MIPVNRPLISNEDIQAVIETLKSDLVSGDTSVIRDCEETIGQILGVNNVVLVNSGTSAIDIAVESLGIEAGDECVMPSFTIMSTVNQLLRKNAKIRLIDSDPINWSLNLDEAESAISESTKLVVPVHIYGFPSNLVRLTEKSKQLGFQILEDAAESFGSRFNNKALGTFGTVGIYSFYANKVVTGGEGGAIVSDDSVLASKARKYRNLNFSSERFVHDGLGWNARMNSLSAALIRSQIRRLDEILRLKRRIGERYRDGLKDHPWFIHPSDSNYGSLNAYWVYGVILNSDTKLDARELQILLEEKFQIQTRRFFCPIHLQPFIHKYNLHFDDLKVSEWLWNRGIYLPSGLGNTFQEIDYVMETLWGLV